MQAKLLQKKRRKVRKKESEGIPPPSYFLDGWGGCHKIWFLARAIVTQDFHPPIQRARARARAPVVRAAKKKSEKVQTEPPPLLFPRSFLWGSPMRGGDGERRGKNGREMEKGGESHKKLRLLLSTAGPDITLSYFLFFSRPLHSFTFRLLLFGKRECCNISTN